MEEEPRILTEYVTSGHTEMWERHSWKRNRVSKGLKMWESWALRVGVYILVEADEGEHKVFNCTSEMRFSIGNVCSVRFAFFQVRKPTQEAYQNELKTGA